MGWSNIMISLIHPMNSEPCLATRLVSQENSIGCGPACLTMIAQQHIAGCTLNTVTAEFIQQGEALSGGVSADGIVAVATALGLSAHTELFIPNKLHLLKYPLILLVNKIHFVVVDCDAQGVLWVLDPLFGRFLYSCLDPASVTSSVAVVFSISNDRSQTIRHPIRQLIRPFTKFKMALVRILLSRVPAFHYLQRGTTS
jgi:ABC-type bacteriocin/lantibiotic exporter with double-glycine peptidase domain